MVRIRTMGYIVAAVVFLVVGSNIVTAIIIDGRSAGRHTDVENAEIRTCEDKTRDRVDNARGWTQAVKVWSQTSQDTSLPAGVRARANRTAQVYQETANSLRTRILLCEPSVLHGREVIDERLLREAKGGL